jgi:hypothetical protein
MSYQAYADRALSAVLVASYPHPYAVAEGEGECRQIPFFGL